MRHFSLPFAVTALALRVFIAAGKTRLIALSCCFEGISASQLRTVTRAVTLTTVAEAADKYRSAAAGAGIVSS